MTQQFCFTQVRGVLSLLLVCILGLQATPGEAWEASKEVISAQLIPASIPAASSSALKTQYNTSQVDWNQSTAEPRTAAGTAGHDRGTALKAETHATGWLKGVWWRIKYCLGPASNTACWRGGLEHQGSTLHAAVRQGKV